MKPLSEAVADFLIKRAGKEEGMSFFKGFFTDEDYAVAGIRISEGKCDKCGLWQKCNSPKMTWSGEGRLKSLIIAEVPGETEDAQGKQLVGKAGQALREKLLKRGFDLDRDFWKINAVNCRTHEGGKNRKPTNSEIQHCKPVVDNAIETLKPRTILLMGGSAVKSMYQGQFSHLEISTWRHLAIPDKKTNAWIVPLYHPSFLARNEKDDITQSVYDRDLEFALDVVQYEEPPEFINPYDHVVCLTKYEKVIELLDWILANPPEWLDYDYETTGIKPFKAGHKIATISLSFDNGESAYAFPWQYEKWFTLEQQGEIQSRWQAILRNSYIRKAAHSVQFEGLWSKWIAGEMPVPLEWCTMNAAHVLDGRKNYNSLDFQAYIRFGIDPWDKDVSAYLKNKKGSEFNRIMEAPLTKLLMYNAIDSLVGGMLRVDQAEEFRNRESQWRAFQSITMPGLRSLIDIQDTGINMNSKYYAQQFLDRNEELKAKEAHIMASEEVKKFTEVTGKTFDFSPDHMRTLLYNILGVKSVKLTDSGLESVDASVLQSIDNALAKEIISYRKLEKVRNTYIAQFLREIDDDSRMRPNFNLHTVQTYRSSSSRPNFQNIPVRDKEAKKISRDGIIPSKGNIILDWDYGAMEFKIVSCLSQDPVMVKYCHDLSTDIHRDQAGLIFGIQNEYVSKDMRFHTKNGFVFPTIYGSWYKNTARNIFEAAMNLVTGHPEKLTVKQYLYEVGILKSLKKPEEDFEQHVKEVESQWWKRFKILKKWQEAQWAKFKEKGFLEMPFGFRAEGYLSRNEIINYPVQGTAFHCLVWSMNEIREAKYSSNWLSLIIGQIHDNLLYDCYPPEKQAIVTESTFIATELIRQYNPWIIVPLMIEWEETEIDGSWVTKKDLAAA